MNQSNRATREKEHFNQLAVTQGSVWWGAQTMAGQIRLKERADLAIQNGKLRPGVVVLEPGAGNGDFTLHLAETGAMIKGIEISPEQAALGNTRLAKFPLAEIVEGDIAQLEYPDDSFDAIVGNSVLHHFDLNEALPEIIRVLKPGGRFFFCEPNMLNPQIAVEKNFALIGRYLQNSPDETAFFRWQIARLLMRHGFEGIAVIPFDFLHPGIPDQWIRGVRRINRLFNRIPIIREIGGSLQIGAHKPF